MDTMLPPIFREQGLPEPSGDQAAGVTSWGLHSTEPDTHIFPRPRCETSGEVGQIWGTSQSPWADLGRCACVSMLHPQDLAQSRPSVFANRAPGTGRSWAHLT